METPHTARRVDVQVNRSNHILHPFSQFPSRRFSLSIHAQQRDRWLPARIRPGADRPTFRLVRIARGACDDFLRQWTRDAKQCGHRFFLRLGHEMNGFWFAWGEDANGNKQGHFVRAWRHLVDIFRAEGASNVS